MHVFVSHSSLDHETAQTVVDAIESRGGKCWIASRDVLPGANYQQAIVEAINRSIAMVLIFSHNANNSEEILKELSLASRVQMPVFPFRIEDLKPTGAYEYELATRQWIDAFKNWDAAMNRLANLLHLQPEDQLRSPGTVPHVELGSQSPFNVQLRSPGLALMLNPAPDRGSIFAS